MRTFVGVPLDRALRLSAGTLQSDLRRWQIPVKLTPTENLHITLLFLGEVEPAKAIELGKTLDECLMSMVKPFPITFKGLGAFPSLNSARVLWLGMTEGEDEMKALSDEVRTAARSLGIRWDPKPFKGHLTIGRVNNQQPIPLRIPAQYMDYSLGTMTVDRVVVYKSDLSPQGAKYGEISTVML